MKRIIKLPALIRWILWTGFIFLILFTLMRLGLFLFFSKQGNTFGNLTNAFFLGLRFDLRTISIILLVMLLLGSLPWIHPFKSKGGKRFWTILLSVIVFLLLFLFVVDFAHYAYLVQRLNASVLNYLEDAGISLNMVWQSYPVIRLVLGLLLATWMIMWLIRLAYRRVRNKPSAADKKTRIISSVVTFLVLGFFVFGRFNQYPLRWSDAFALGNDYKANLALNPFESFFNTLKFRNKYDEKKVKSLYPVIAQYYQLPVSDSVLNYTRLVSPRPGSLTSKPNIVLVICESFSGYKSSMWGNPLNTTPFFDSMSRQGLFFDHCFTPTYGTARGIWATITGTPDVEMPKTASRNPGAVDQHSIINDFSGYEKLYFLGGSASWANVRGLLTNNITGLKLYEGEDFKSPTIDVWGISDKNLFLESNKILGQQEKPFFAVIQTADNHRPYTIPKEDQEEFKKVDFPLDSLRKYGFESIDELNAFRYTDFCYRKFIEAARQEKYFNNTVFVFIGDHGIPGNAGKMFPQSWTEQRLTAMHVPLLFYNPSLIAPRRSNMICSQLDVLPTIAGLSNISYNNTTLGKDLLDSTSRAFAFIFDPDLNMSGVVKGDYFYRRQIKTGKEELFSVVNNNKPAKDAATDSSMHEMRNLTEALHETAKYLLLNNKKNH
ncbi:alkaline phosphatase family protein [Paraflavitalea sp. CAU 1676]|uniref:LTA synthase family protein n=1 Tax=Paraflavitalea sp. CAU 1676 TaxID=3032598 RepID=UPI0023DBA8D8|nr:alkaline phosphatase family protein [Paraflavitalea sp. CAU 1676]MDF2190113.1 sulfatase-like hydrolase/transferase [Paraflavitalea sp. CAU 1676]